MDEAFYRRQRELLGSVLAELLVQEGRRVTFVTPAGEVENVNRHVLAIAARHDPYAALRFRDFRLLVAGTFLTVVAEQMLGVAVGWELYERTHAALALVTVPPLTGRVVDQTGTQERAVGDAAPLHQQALHAELAVEDTQDVLVELRRDAERVVVGDAVQAKHRVAREDAVAAAPPRPACRRSGR